MSKNRCLSEGYSRIQILVVIFILLIAGGLILNKVYREQRKMSELNHPQSQQKKPIPAEEIKASPEETPSDQKPLEIVEEQSPSRISEKRSRVSAVNPVPPTKQQGRTRPVPVIDKDPIKVIDRVMDALDSNDPDIREDSLDELMEIEDELVNLPLLKALEDENPDIREKAMDVMDYIDSPVVLPSLERAIIDKDEDIRAQALSTLEDIEDRRAIDDLIMYGLNSDYPDTREDAKDSLEFITDQEFNTLEEWQNWWEKSRDSFVFE